MARLDELCVRQTTIDEGENDGEGGQKRNAIKAHNAAMAFLSFAKFATRMEATVSQPSTKKMSTKDNCGKVAICSFCNLSTILKH